MSYIYPRHSNMNLDIVRWKKFYKGWYYAKKLLPCFRNYFKGDTGWYQRRIPTTCQNVSSRSLRGKPFSVSCHPGGVRCIVWSDQATDSWPWSPKSKKVLTPVWRKDKTWSTETSWTSYTWAGTTGGFGNCKPWVRLSIYCPVWVVLQTFKFGE